MWREIARFNIAGGTNLIVLVEYEKELEPLDFFDSILVFYENEFFCCLLMDDILQEALLSLRNHCVKVIQQKSRLPEGIDFGTVGSIFNTDIYYEKSELICYRDIWFFSEFDVEAWFYNCGNTIYLEITPSYQWLYDEPPANRPYQSFEDFMKTYQPIVVHAISSEQARAWISVCDKTLCGIDPRIEEWFFRLNDTD